MFATITLSCGCSEKEGTPDSKVSDPAPQDVAQSVSLPANAKDEAFKLRSVLTVGDQEMEWEVFFAGDHTVEFSDGLQSDLPGA